jgi:hypothetical protein
VSRFERIRERYEKAAHIDLKQFQNPFSCLFAPFVSATELWRTKLASLNLKNSGERPQTASNFALHFTKRF